jgi:hypothetical protein
MVVSAPVGSLMAANFGLNYPMLFSAVPFLLSTFVALSMKEPGVHSRPSKPNSYLQIARQGLLFFARHKVLRLMALDGVVVSVAAYFVLWLYQPLLRSVGMPIYYFGFVASLLTLVEMMIAANFVRIEHLAGSGQRYLTLTALATGVPFILAAAIPNLASALLLVVIAGGFGLTRLELMNAYMNKVIPSEQRATVLSSISMFRRLVLMIFNPVVGFLADNSLAAALLGVGLLPLLVFFFSPLKQDMLEAQD